MLRNVFFYVVDPGAVAVMKELFAAAPSNVKSVWVAEGWAAEYFEQENISFYQMSELETMFSLGSNILILGSQTTFHETQRVIRLAKKNGWLTVFVLDHWCNYSLHFRDGEDWNFPDQVMVMDKFSKTKMVEAGIPETLLSIIGHPAIEVQVEKIKDVNISRIKSRLNLTSSKIWLLALEPISVDFPTRNYDEFKITEMAVVAIESINQSSMAQNILLIRLHPRQDRKAYESWLLSKEYRKVYICPQDLDVSESIAITDGVIGIVSAYVICSMIAGKPCISIQLEPLMNSVDVLDPIKVTSEHDFFEKLRAISNKKHSTSWEEGILSTPMGSTTTFWCQINNMIKQRGVRNNEEN